MTELKQSSVAILEKAIDEKIAKAAKKGGQSLATVTRVDNDGTTWVHVYGGSEETPVSRMTSAASVGDVINVSFSGLSCTGIGNVSSPSASQKQVQRVASETATAIAGIMGGLLQVRRLVADKVSTKELDAEVARIMDAEIEHIAADVIDALELDAHYAQIDLANITAADVDSEKVRDLVARSGWFERVSMEEGVVTGQLKGVLVDGDTARFANIYADALKILGDDGLYHALNISGLSEEDAQALVSAYGEALDGGLHGSHIIAETITATQVDVSSLVAAMLLAKFVQVGASAGTHIEAQGDRFSFFQGGSGWSSLTDDYLYPQVDNPTGSPADNGYYELVDGEYVRSTDAAVDPSKTYYRYNVSADTALPGEVAYIAVDPTTRESTFYMTRSVVVKDLRFGDWMWYGRRNRNMALKWIGGEV